MRLHRRGPGDYYLGCFEVIKDPTSGSEPGGWGYTSWLVYEHPRGFDWGPMAITPTLGEARRVLAGEYVYAR